MRRTASTTPIAAKPAVNLLELFLLLSDFKVGAEVCEAFEVVVGAEFGVDEDMSGPDVGEGWF
jgi:hypothetical protein